FSFAGLKTAAARAYAGVSNVCSQNKADLAASFQRTVRDVIVDRTGRAMDMYEALGHKGRTFVVAGGVAANTDIRKGLSGICANRGYRFVAPPLKYCTDNAAMIALAGAEHYVLGETSPLDAKARPRWPLDEAGARERPKSGSGRKGPKS
ncbi:MAG TPA: tRNA (adenosine(37)-N6)-threonylcarbamoyltransferase complex transferase subunit TsaD, partial [Hellea balneolensis]|nr:tRNA (adenosine(37)-N6)-threonylcarbamoyltransferase complex transferase subunit TsaD [Hellea balneolensis]